MNASSLLFASSALSSLWIASIWQGMVLALFTLVLLRTLPDLSPRLRYRVWFAAYGACVLLPLAEWLGAARGWRGSAVPAAPAPMLSPLFTVDSRWSLLCAAVWAASSLVATVRLIAGVWSVRSLLRTALPLATDEWARYADLLQLRSRGRVALYKSDAIEAPVAIGLWKPAIVLPAQLLTMLNEEQIRQVLRHEGEHLERRDDWALLLMGCMRCLFPLHPALVWFERQLVATREMACDDAVLRSAAPRTYAMNLTRIAEAALHRSPGVLPSFVGGSSQLGERIEYILSGRRDSNVRARGPLLGAATGLFAVCAVMVQSPALVAFQPSLQTTQTVAVAVESPIDARLTPAVLPASLRQQVAPATVSMRTRTRRPHASHPAPRLLATAEHRIVPASYQPAELAHPAAFLILWNDARGGFSAAVLFQSAPCAGKPNAAQPGFFLLQI